MSSFFTIRPPQAALGSSFFRSAMHCPLQALCTCRPLSLELALGACLGGLIPHFL